MNSATSLVTLNNDQRSFIINNGGYVGCFGFDNCYKDSVQLSELLNVPSLMPSIDGVGTIAQYENYCKLTNLVRGRDIGTWFTPGTQYDVKRILTKAMDERWNVRLYYGDETGRSWMDEYDMVGRVGRSTGWMKVPLLVADGEDGGGAILTDRIIKIVRFVKRNNVWVSQVLFQQNNFHLPIMKIVEKESEKYDFSVTCNGQVHARFKTRVKAQRWIDFMLGLVPKA